jgi:hypothetical protein
VKDTDIIAAIAPDAVSLMDKAIAEIKRLRQENATLTAERDEARRMYCGRVSRDVPLDAFDIAKNHGWDCFPQEDEPCQ